MGAAVEYLEVEDAHELLADLRQLGVGLLHALRGRVDAGADVQDPEISGRFEGGDVRDLLLRCRVGVQWGDEGASQGVLDVVEPPVVGFIDQV